MSNNIEQDREVIAENIKPSNCLHCGSSHIQFEGCHFPRFFFSCETCEKRIELVYNWVTGEVKRG